MIVDTDLTDESCEHDQPVRCDSILGAIGGPCRGHLVSSHVTLVEEVGQMNLLPCLKQTWAVSPGQNDIQQLRQLWQF